MAIEITKHESAEAQEAGSPEVALIKSSIQRDNELRVSSEQKVWIFDTHSEGMRFEVPFSKILEKAQKINEILGTGPLILYGSVNLQVMHQQANFWSSEDIDWVSPKPVVYNSELKRELESAGFTKIRNEQILYDKRVPADSGGRVLFNILHVNAKIGPDDKEVDISIISGKPSGISSEKILKYSKDLVYDEKETHLKAISNELALVFEILRGEVIRSENAKIRLEKYGSDIDTFLKANAEMIEDIRSTFESSKVSFGAQIEQGIDYLGLRKASVVILERK